MNVFKFTFLRARALLSLSLSLHTHFMPPPPCDVDIPMVEDKGDDVLTHPNNIKCRLLLSYGYWRGVVWKLTRVF